MYNNYISIKLGEKFKSYESQKRPKNSQKNFEKVYKKEKLTSQTSKHMIKQCGGSVEIETDGIN